MNKSNVSKRTILIVDDHPINVDSYHALLSNIESNNDAEYLFAFDCKQAYNYINKIQLLNLTIDFALIDISLPSFEEKKLFSGSDVGILIKKIFPLCKIIIISMYKEPIWVNQICKSINPDGFIAKSDINYNCFPEIFKTIEKNEKYLSKSIIESQKILLQKNIRWDENDSKILQLIAQGVKTINLPDYIPLCLSTIEKRKANIKKQLILDSGSDKDLIDMAKKFGLI